MLSNFAPWRVEEDIIAMNSRTAKHLTAHHNHGHHDDDQNYDDDDDDDDGHYHHLLQQMPLDCFLCKIWFFLKTSQNLQQQKIHPKI